MIRLSNNDYSRIELHFIMDRNVTGILVRYFLPMILLVLTSFTSLYLTNKFFVIQAIIGILCLVCGVLYSAVMNLAFTPKTGNFTSIDLFNIVCILFILASLALVLYRMETLQRLADMTTGDMKKMDENMEVPEASSSDSEKKLKIMTLIIPCSYQCFMIVYCVLVMSLK